MGLRPAYIYKIVPISTPVTSPIPDRLPLSVLDESDGFIHLSTAVQVPATAGRFFVQETSLQILRLTYDKVENKIRWEDSKGTGMLLVASLGKTATLKHADTTSTSTR